LDRGRSCGGRLVGIDDLNLLRVSGPDASLFALLVRFKGVLPVADGTRLKVWANFVHGAGVDVLFSDDKAEPSKAFRESGLKG
jgi:hypothetical protein